MSPGKDGLSFVYATDSILGRAGVGGPAAHAGRALFERWPFGLVLARGDEYAGLPLDRVRFIRRPWWCLALQSTRLRRFQIRPPAVERVEFDRMASRGLPPCRLVIGDNSTSLLTFRRAAEHGAKRILLQHNTPFTIFRRELEEEHRRWGGPPPFPTDDLVERSEMELREADLVIAFSDLVASALAESRVEAERIRKVHFGVDARAFSPSPQPSTGFTVVSVGWLNPYKGFPYLVDAFRDARIPGSDLVLHGGSEVVFYHQLVERLRGDARVEVVRGPVMETYRRATVFVLPSVADGYGLVTLEAMACGLPVVVTHGSGSAMDVEDGVNGFVVPSRDPAAIRDRLLALQDPALRARMGAAARETALRHTWDGFRTSLGRVAGEFLEPAP